MFLSQSAFEFQVERKILTVSELTAQIRNRIEPHFLDVWIVGEVSNFRAASSGHLYFTLKDEMAQLRVVCFRNQARYLKFKPLDGISLIARGRLGIYEARGEYQLIAEFLEPAGAGALQLAFEQLKAKLAAEGLFAPARKKPLPVLPRTVGLVTSPTGAVVRDILHVLRRRFPNINVILYPVRVQGEGAAEEIVGALRHFNEHSLTDVIIVARGGGSIEDLWAFNEESVARAIAVSRIPVISGVGHETDFTIADFVADLRAPTPSAAAELVIQRKADFETELSNRERRLLQVIRLKLAESRERLNGLSMHRVFYTLPARLAERAQRLDERVIRIERALAGRITHARELWLQASAGVWRFDLRRLVEWKRTRFEESKDKLESGFKRGLADRRARWEQAAAVLRERNPATILSRGYSIVRDAEGAIVRDAATVPLNSDISIRLATGELGATVRSRKT